MAKSVVRVEGLVKDYGHFRALAGVDFDVQPGEVFGFLGPNGSGKSTTIRVMLNLLKPTAGRVEVLGVDPNSAPAAVRSKIGYLPGELGLTGTRTAGEYLAHLVRLRAGAGQDRVAELAERFGLDLDKRIRGLSKGNKQKIGVVQAFMHRPELLILDEPTSGLDPLLQKEFLDLTLEARDEGATVFMSSHVLGEVQHVADRVAVIRHGKVVDIDDIAALRAASGQRVTFRFADEVDESDFSNIAGVSQVKIEGLELNCLLHGEPDALLKAAARHRVVHWSARDRDLEDLFLDYYRDEQDEQLEQPEQPEQPEQEASDAG